MAAFDFTEPAEIWTLDEDQRRSGSRGTKVGELTLGECLCFTLERPPSDQRNIVITTATHHLLGVTDIQMIANSEAFGRWLKTR